MESLQFAWSLKGECRNREKKIIPGGCSMVRGKLKILQKTGDPISWHVDSLSVL